MSVVLRASTAAETVAHKATTETTETSIDKAFEKFRLRLLIRDTIPILGLEVLKVLEVVARAVAAGCRGWFDTEDGDRTVAIEVSAVACVLDILDDQSLKSGHQRSIIGLSSKELFEDKIMMVVAVSDVSCEPHLTNCTLMAFGGPARSHLTGQRCGVKIESQR